MKIKIIIAILLITLLISFLVSCKNNDLPDIDTVEQDSTIEESRVLVL